MFYEHKNKIYSFFSTIYSCLKLSWKISKSYTILRLFSSLILPLFQLLEALMGKYILDLLTGEFGQSSPMLYLFFFIGILLIIQLSNSVIQKIQLYTKVMNNDIINRELVLNVMDKAGNSDIEFLDNTNYYDKLISCIRDSPAFADLIWNTISVISAAFTMLITFVTLSRLKILYGFLMVIASIPSAIVAAKYTKIVYSLSLEQINGERQKSYLQTLLLDKRFAQDIRIYEAQKIIKKKYLKIWNILFKEKKSILKIRNILTGVLDCIPVIMISIIGIDIGQCVLNNTATIGDYSLYTGLVAELWSGVCLLSSAVVQIYDNHLKISNLESLNIYKNSIDNTGDIELKQVETISFKNVSFTYPGSENEILHNISFQVKRHEKLALVGLNGSGKSTLIKLLLRFYDVSNGSIEINGIDIRDYNLSSLRRNFSVYFQDSPNYSFNLRENITIADSDKILSDKKVITAIKESGLDNILKYTPMGLDTFLTRLFDNKGIELSGGQHQKLAISRTFYRDHSALILDEPSSNLDPRSEHILFEHLKSFTKDKTVLFTSHRLTNIILADRILVLENGSIIEEGTQNELLKKNGRYAELYHYQLEHYQI